MSLTKRARRRLVIVVAALVLVGVWVINHPENYQAVTPLTQDTSSESGESGEVNPTNYAPNEEGLALAVNVLAELKVAEKDLSKKYDREAFYTNWEDYNGCDMRNVILQRDLQDTVLDGCIVMSGVLNDPYTGKVINFSRGAQSSSAVQIDHVVALSDAWATGAQTWTAEKRKALSQDPLNLLAVDGPENQRKSDGDAAEWLPPNEAFQCQYVARQISVKYKYVLWVTAAEKEAMSEVLETCPQEASVGLENLEL